LKKLKPGGRVMKSLKATTVLFVLLLLGCSRQQSVRNGQAKRIEPPSRVVKVTVDTSGRVFLDNQFVTLDELKREFAELKENNGAVRYYSQNPELPESKAVKQALAEAHVLFSPSH
jgi:biopolymer transport protein ExbD